MPLRKIEALPLDIEPPALIGVGYDDAGAEEPVIEWGDPRDLYVDDDYQRTVSKKGEALIRRVAKGRFSWAKFKLPTVTMDEAGRRLLLNGQHTASMAVTRGIYRIPWLLVQTKDKAAEAEAFVGQNTDQTAVNALQKHKALVLAGEPEALTVEQVCQRAAVMLVPFKPQTWFPGQTMALEAIRGLVSRRHAAGARRVLEILAKAELAPIGAHQIKAVEQLLFADEFKGLVQDEKLIKLMYGEVGARIEREAAVFSAQMRTPKWQGLVAQLWKASRARAAA